MGDAAVHLSLTVEEIQALHLRRKWQKEVAVPSTQRMTNQIGF